MYNFPASPPPPLFFYVKGLIFHGDLIKDANFLAVKQKKTKHV